MSDMQWLEQLHREHYHTLLRLARIRLSQTSGRTTDAEDIVQQAFLLAGQKNIRSHEAPLGWLCKTVDNLCRQHARRCMVRFLSQQRLLERAPAVSSAGDDEAALLLAMEQLLSPEDWTLLHLYCVQGVPPEELARQRNISVGALRVQIHRIRKKLKKTLPEL